MSPSMLWLIDQYADLCTLIDSMVARAQEGEYICASWYFTMVQCKDNVINQMIESRVF
jgi:hypothetical protein